LHLCASAGFGGVELSTNSARVVAPAYGKGKRGRRHERHHQQGKETSINPFGSIFAWTCRVICRGRSDNTQDVTACTEALEKVCIEAVEAAA
jgi:isocitrate dehydrogenase